MGKGLRIPNGEVSQHLTVHQHLSLAKAVHKLAVGQAMLASRSIDAHDPKASHVPFALTTVAVGMTKGM